MMASEATADRLTNFRWTSTAIGRFVARRTSRSAVVWAYIFGAYSASKTLGFAKAYPTPEARLKLTHSFGNNTGLSALLGLPHHIETIAGWANWNTLGVLTIIGSIWALLLATKYFRGEETAGRTELLLAGPTTPRRGAANVLAGLSSAFALLYIITAVLFIIIGRLHTVDFTTTAALFFALASVSGAAMFLAIGALTSQLMPTRSRASSVAAVIFGVCFLVRAMGDVTNQHWLLDISPLGWIEKLQPLVGSQAIWLLPIAITIAVCGGLTVWLAGRRDLGDSIIADRDNARPHMALLNSPFPAALRLNRAISLSWLTGITLVSLFYGVLTKSAVQAFNQAGSLKQNINKVEHAAHTTSTSLFLGIVFFILMALVMAYVASAISRVREDEAEGYIDNFLVRPVSRQQWLWGRAGLIICVSLAACTLGSLAVWIGQSNQGNGVTLHTLFLAGLNMLAPAWFTLGVGLFALGVRPRLTSLVAYGVIGWSFLLSLVSSGVNLSHWLLDTSILHQVSLAPASPPDWQTNYIIMALALLLAITGIAVFKRRDLQLD